MRKISEIANEIVANKQTVGYAAQPYLEAMTQITGLDENFGADSATSVIMYFLGNAAAWKGPLARSIKEELRQMLKAHAATKK